MTEIIQTGWDRVNDFPAFPPDYEGAPSWFCAAKAHAGINIMSKNAGPGDKQCKATADGMRCEAIARHLDSYYHRASWGDGAFTLVWGGFI